MGVFPLETGAMGATGAGATTGVTTGAGTTTEVPAASVSPTLVRMLLMRHWRRVSAALRKSSKNGGIGWSWVAESRARAGSHCLTLFAKFVSFAVKNSAEIQVVARQERKLGNS
jgi:hypothetical protein